MERGGGQTNTQAALSLLYTAVFTPDHGDRPLPDRAIVVTDGRSNVQASDSTRCLICGLQCFDAVGWAAGRTPGL